MKATENTAEKVPTVQDQIKYLKDQMPLKRLQVELQRLNTDFVELKVREFEAISKLQTIEHGQKSSQEEQDLYIRDHVIQHTVTDEDLEVNPDLAKAGIVSGQTIGIPKEVYFTDQVKLASKIKQESEILDEVEDSNLKVVQD